MLWSILIGSRVYGYSVYVSYFILVLRLLDKWLASLLSSNRILSICVVRKYIAYVFTGIIVIVLHLESKFV